MRTLNSAVYGCFVDGAWFTFDTLHEARMFASGCLALTGVIVGIEAVYPREVGL